MAHRAAWEYTRGPVPAGLFVLHRCDNPPCCNPAHLFLGTQADNMADMQAKGRQAKGERHSQAKLTAGAVADMRREYATGSTSLSKLAAAHGVTMGAVWRIIKRLNWVHVT